MSGPLLYKIMPASLWAQAQGTMPWAPVDLRDGFIHLSDASQVRETAHRHFRGQPDLVLLEIAPSALRPGTLRWEISRGGASFPHVYGDIPREAVVRVTPLPEDAEGFRFPRDLG